jgi:oligopeptide transport system substrate-binding protein
VKAVDDATLEVRLTQPNAAFLAMLAHPSLVPIDKVLVNRFGEQWTKPEHIVTSGPYKLSAWVVNERIVAERNPRYWDNEHTVINKVTWLPIHSEAADVNRYKAGEIDIVYTLPINQFAQLKKTMGDQLNVSPQLATYYYEFNTTRPPFNDPRVRLALNMALDKDIIAEKVLGQGQRPAWLISQPDIGGVKLQNPDYASWPREKRIAEAKKLLSEAGTRIVTRWCLICCTTRRNHTSAWRSPPVRCGRKTSAWRRSCKTRSGRRCSTPCTRTILTRCAMRGLPTMTMPLLS